MSNANLPAADVELIGIPLLYFPQITIDVADANVKQIVPFAFHVERVTARLRAIGNAGGGGDANPTDLDVDVYANTTQLATLAIVDGSAIAGSGSGVSGTLIPSGTSLDFAAGSFLHLKLLDVGGGTNPTMDGLIVTVWVSRR